MENGSICDVTGKPRRVEIQYVCDPDVKGIMLQWVKEYRTCHYLAQVSLPQLCEDPLLRVRGEPFSYITCHQVLEETPEIADDASEWEIKLSDYELRKYSEHLLVARHKQLENLIFIVTDDNHESLTERVGLHFQDFLQKGILMDAELAQQQFEQGLEFKALLYDKNGRFIATIHVSVIDGDVVVTVDTNYSALSDNFARTDTVTTTITTTTVSVHDEL